MQAVLTQILLPILLPLVTGYLTTGGMQWLKKISETINKLPSWLKPVIVFALSTAITIGAKSLGIEISSSDVSMLNGTDIQAILGGLVAIMLHHTTKSAQIQAVLDIPATYTDGVKNAPVSGEK